MRAGLIRRRVTVQRYTATQNSLGEEVEIWSNLFSAWAAVAAVTASERFASGSQQELATVTHRVTMRWRDDYTAGPKDRVAYDGKYFDIESAVDPDGRRRETVMLCRELVGL